MDIGFVYSLYSILLIFLISNEIFIYWYTEMFGIYNCVVQLYSSLQCQFMLFHLVFITDFAL